MRSSEPSPGGALTSLSSHSAAAAWSRRGVRQPRERVEGRGPRLEGDDARVIARRRLRIAQPLLGQNGGARPELRGARCVAQRLREFGLAHEEFAQVGALALAIEERDQRLDGRLLARRLAKVRVEGRGGPVALAQPDEEARRLEAQLDPRSRVLRGRDLTLPERQKLAHAPVLGVRRRELLDGLGVSRIVVEEPAVQRDRAIVVAEGIEGDAGGAPAEIAPHLRLERHRVAGDQHLQDGPRVGVLLVQSHETLDRPSGKSRRVLAGLVATFRVAASVAWAAGPPIAGEVEQLGGDRPRQRPVPDRFARDVRSLLQQGEVARSGARQAEERPDERPAAGGSLELGERGEERDVRRVVLERALEGRFCGARVAPAIAVQLGRAGEKVAGGGPSEVALRRRVVEGAGRLVPGARRLGRPLEHVEHFARRNVDRSRQVDDGARRDVPVAELSGDANRRAPDLEVRSSLAAADVGRSREDVEVRGQRAAQIAALGFERPADLLPEPEHERHVPSGRPLDRGPVGLDEPGPSVGRRPPGVRSPPGRPRRRAPARTLVASPRTRGRRPPPAARRCLRPRAARRAARRRWTRRGGDGPSARGKPASRRRRAARAGGPRRRPRGACPRSRAPAARPGPPRCADSTSSAFA